MVEGNLCLVGIPDLVQEQNLPRPTWTFVFVLEHEQQACFLYKLPKEVYRSEIIFVDEVQD
ncbi:hypothetical protein RvY_00397 [Ramazzottius varieornatus]|uniref:Uncharacterized protein n=1 Tax=Ramazzottius varieornatus TaxID=947166 RepID=A0A1D1UJZ6_RAMVA|nr:hypothetical protein RvY_00397 [Ramazzottius varieornatus]